MAVFLSILFAQLTPHISDELHSAATQPAYQQAVIDGAHSGNPADAALSKGLLSHDVSAAGQVISDSSVIQQLNPTPARPFQVGFADSMDTVFLAVTAIAGIALPLVVFWKEVPLRTAGGLQARAETSGPRVLVDADSAPVGGEKAEPNATAVRAEPDPAATPHR
ncbi:hypothetical protein [Nocardia sp. BSTN01]|uniref:hypothetical protein n=1 Tax=Nocardia sp. BSTN01 TaxID=2783665 RepID=UPI001E3925B8|nr:hypothetical protein [Nocardia sp. BSTN01]